MSSLGSVKIGAGTPYLKRMWPHYWLGYLLLLLSLIHTVVPIQAGRLHGLNVLGLWLAAGDRVVAARSVFSGPHGKAKLALLADVRRGDSGCRPRVAEPVVV
jgi:hypothetical protein